MGKTNQPLTIVVTDDLWDTPEIRALAEAGHRLFRVWDAPPILQQPIDLILGDSCWFMNPALLKYLGIALKQARARKRDAKAAQEDTPGPKAVSTRKGRPGR